MKKVLISGFEPFGDDDMNPSWEAIKRLPDQTGNVQVIKVSLPVVRYRAMDVLKTYIGQYDPDVIISAGQAGGRKGITVERIGINCDDYRIPDNEGNRPQDEPVIEDGPDACFASIPVRKIVNAMTDAGIEASVSNSAGTYVCNHVLYSTAYLCRTMYPEKTSGFIHVPYIREQGKSPYMELDDIVKALEIAVRTAAGE